MWGLISMGACDVCALCLCGRVGVTGVRKKHRAFYKGRLGAHVRAVCGADRTFWAHGQALMAVPVTSNGSFWRVTCSLRCCCVVHCAAIWCGAARGGNDGWTLPFFVG